MSREIEFRFWLGHTKKMTYAHTLAEIPNIIKEFTSDIIALQFTGSRDRNGNKIYEGDIVKTVELDWEHDEDDKDKTEPRISFVTYLNNRFWIDAEYFGWEGEGLWDWSLIEVIGNIYENPDLIPLKTQPNEQ